MALDITLFLPSEPGASEFLILRYGSTLIQGYT